MQKYKVFIINLKKDIHKREYITKHFKDRGVEFELIDAIYGKALSEEQLATLADVEASKKIMGKEISLNEIGCSLSHQKVYQRILDENLDGAFIFEDDVYTCKDIKKIMDIIYQNKSKLGKESWVALSRTYINVRKKMFKIDSQYSVHKGLRIKYTDAYFVGNAAARKLINLNSQVKYVADWFKGGYINKLNIFAVNSACNIQNPILESSINETRNNNSRKPILFKVKDLIKKVYIYRLDILRLLGIYKRASLSTDIITEINKK